MDVTWAAVGAVTGMPAGTALRGPVFLLSVRTGEPDRMTCSACAAPVPRWLVISCGHCGSSIGASAALELITAAVLALLLGRFGGQPDAAAFGFLGAVGVALAAIDISVQRLPDRLTLPAFPVLIMLLAAAAVIGHDDGALVRALLGGTALAAGYLLLALLRPGQLGGGDIKLAGLAGLTLGWLGWPTLVAGACLGFVLSAVVSVALLATRRITLRSAICFGPSLLGGALVAIMASGGGPGT
jgi:leader peptidase (prepilin peptidase)/N-methyltransferase